MAIEVYESRVWLQWRWIRITQRYFWLANNVADIDAWSFAGEVNERIVNGSFWFNFLTLCISETARFRRITTRRVTPIATSAAHLIFPGGGVLGQWPFTCGETMTACKLTWVSDNDSYGKYQNRIGPLGTGTMDGDHWNPLFVAAVHAWAAQHGILYATPSGGTFIGCNVDRLGIANQVIGAQVTWPPSHQNNRRWVM